MQSVLNEGYLSPHSISSRLRSELNSESDPELRTRAEIESKCFEFYFNKGNLVPQVKRIDADGEHHCYPDLNRFSEADWAYIKKRLVEESHPFLRARYAHLLWLQSKHNTYAHEAIESYKNLASLYFEKSINDAKLFYNQLEALQCFHSLSLRVKYNTDICKSELLAYLNHERLPLIYKCRIVDLITASALFKRSDYQGLTDFMLSCLRREDAGFSVMKSSLDSLLILAQKEDRSNGDILVLLGENELKHAESRQEDQTGMIPLTCYQRAADYFKRAGAQEQFQDAAKLYANQKHKVKLARIGAELSDETTDRYDKFLNELVDELLIGDALRPFWFLATEDRILLPKEIAAEEVMNERKHSIMDLFTFEVFDQNNNAKRLSEEEKVKHHQFQYYSFTLQIMALVLMEKLFYKGFRTGKITIKSFMNFFNCTWFAQSLNGYTVDGEPSTFSWMELLGPGLYSLVKELSGEICDKDYEPDYTLSIDTLSIKIEGVIRDFASVSGVPTSKIREDEVQEMNLEELLSSDQVKALFSQDDVLLWRSILTKKGYNTRNNTAHGFYRPKNYTRQKALLLLLCIYRLSGYRIIASNEH